MSGAFRRDHHDVNRGRRNNLLEMDAETVRDHQDGVGLEVRPDLAFKQGAMMLVGSQNHDQIGAAHRFGRRQHLEAIRQSLLGRVSPRSQSH